MGLLPALFGVGDLGKMGMKPAGPLFSQAALHRIQNCSIVLPSPDSAKGPGVQVSKVDTGQQPLVYGAELQHLGKAPQLVDLPHGFRADHDFRKPHPAKLVQCQLKGSLRQLQGLLPGNFPAGPGVDHNTVAAHDPGRLGGVGDILHGAQPLFLLHRGKGDVIGRVDAQRHVPRRRLFLQLQQLFFHIPDSPAALILKGIQPKLLQIGRDLRRPLKSHCRKAVWTSRRTKTCAHFTSPFRF